MKLMSPHLFDRQLATADAKAKIKLRKQLREFDEDWVLQFMQQAIKGMLDVSSDVGRDLVKVAIERRRGAELIGMMIRISLEKDLPVDDIPKYILLTVTFLVINPMISVQLFKACRNNDGLLKMVQLLMLAYYKRGGCIKVVNHVTNDNRLETPVYSNDPMVINWAVPSMHQAMALDIVTAARAICEHDNQLLSQTFNADCRWDLVDGLWRKIKEDATYVLHTQGDQIEVKVELLRAFNFTHFTIKASGVFPNASVVCHFDKMGVDGILECELIDGRLMTDGFDLCLNEYIRFVATATLLSGYWKIVSGEDDEHSHTSKRGNGSVRTTERCRPKPHPMRLREGFHPSRKAIEECLRLRGQAPAPGKTWRTPLHGAIVVSKATTTVTDDDLSQALAV
ncbi:MAG: hypothetical protein PHW95_03865 [Patescibacteria group bacterium]|nr:hypothetical protein [Patescibacteria group bacterium]